MQKFVAFCVKRGAFSYQIGNEKQAVVGEGEIVIKPEQAYVVTQLLEAIYTSAATGKPVYFDNSEE